MRYECPSAPPCTIWVEDSARPGLMPDHVCLATAALTTQQYATALVSRTLLGEEKLRNPVWRGLVTWAKAWPLPVRGGPLDLFARRWAGQVDTGITSLLHGLDVPADMERLGLVISRSGPGWRCRLFASVGLEPDAPHEGRLLLGATTKPGPIPAGWTWGPAVAQREPKSVGSSRLAEQAADRLLRWYDQQILHKPWVGRPAGTGYWRDAAEFEDALRTALAALKTQGRKLTAEEVANFFSAHSTTYPKCGARQLRAWRARFSPGVRWPDLVARLNS
jgi:hypothetical protein